VYKENISCPEKTKKKDVVLDKSAVKAMIDTGKYDEFSDIVLAEFRKEGVDPLDKFDELIDIILRADVKEEFKKILFLYRSIVLKTAMVGLDIHLSTMFPEHTQIVNRARWYADKMCAMEKFFIA
jgi:hypothetical protein